MEPNNRLLGKRLGKDRGKVVAALAALTPADIDKFQVLCFCVYGWVGGRSWGCQERGGKGNIWICGRHCRGGGLLTDS